MKKLILAITICTSLIACSGGDSESLNQYENSLVGSWESLTTPHPNGNNNPNTYYKSFFTFRNDKTGINGFDEVISTVDHFSQTNNIKWKATNTTITVKYEDDTEETGNYELIDSNNIRVINENGETLVYTKQ